MNKKLSDFEEGWIVGFIEGEGSFTVNPLEIKRRGKKEKCYRYFNPVFYLVQKEREIPERIRNLLGVGRINRHGPYFRLSVRKKSEVIKLMEFLDGKLKSRPKTRQFERWKEKVLEWKSRARKERPVRESF